MNQSIYTIRPTTLFYCSIFFSVPGSSISCTLKFIHREKERESMFSMSSKKQPWKQNLFVCVHLEALSKLQQWKIACGLHWVDINSCARVLVSSKTGLWKHGNKNVRSNSRWFCNTCCNSLECDCWNGTFSYYYHHDLLPLVLGFVNEV